MPMGAVRKLPPTALPRPSARARILSAAADLARDVGPANLSLDAVAARAGVSKGGLLYHFPAKLDLLEALVGDHLETFDRDLETQQALLGAGPAAALHAYLDVSLADCQKQTPPPAGVLAAIVQHPEMLKPIKHFKRQILDRLKADTGHDATTLVAFLVMEGLRSMKLFDADVLSDEETATAMEALRAMIGRIEEASGA
jgi:AcrR family transcriptional regulator